MYAHTFLKLVEVISAAFIVETHRVVDDSLELVVMQKESSNKQTGDIMRPNRIEGHE